MFNYLVPVFRIQFNLCYRYGYTYIPSSNLITFDGSFNNETKIKVIELFNVLSPFEYDDEYIILHIENEKEILEGNVFVSIQNVVSIYPLSQQAKISIESKIDQRIRLEEPFFESSLLQIESNILIEEIKNAINALWAICKLSEDNTYVIQKIGIENILRGLDYRKNGIQALKIKGGGNFWSILIAYDRFDYFPNTKIGYFYDAGQVFAFSKDRPTFEGSKFHECLQKLNIENPEVNFSEVIKFLESEESVKEYKSLSTENDLKQYVVAPLFLTLKNELRDIDDISRSSLIKYTSKFLEFGIDSKATLILLGAFFGYKRFYDIYYDQLGLRFFKFPKLESQSGLINKEEYYSVNPLKSEPELEIQPISQPEPENKIISPKKDEDVTSTEKPAIILEITDKTRKLNTYQKIILDEIKLKNECDLAGLCELIASKFRGKRFNNKNIKSIIAEIPEIEVFKVKGKEKARLREIAISRNIQNNEVSA